MMTAGIKSDKALIDRLIDRLEQLTKAACEQCEVGKFKDFAFIKDHCEKCKVKKLGIFTI